MPKKEFDLSKKREELSKYLRVQGLSNNICGNILRIVIGQDKEFIKRITKRLKLMNQHALTFNERDSWVDNIMAEEAGLKLT